MATPTPIPTSAPVGEICLPVAGCLPVQGGISEGGYIILLVLIAVILLVSLGFFIIVRYGSAILKAAREAREEAQQAKDQVKNSHTTNFRDDIDQKDAGSHRKLDVIVTELQAVRRDMTSGFESVHGRIDGLDSRVTGIDVRLNRRSGTIGAKEV